MRLFIAVEIPQEIKIYLKDLQREISFFDQEAKLIIPNTFHITLKFLGEVDDSKTDQIKRLLEKVPFIPFSLMLDKAGYFDDKVLRVAWVGIDDLYENVSELQKAIDKQLLYLFAKEQHFVPHVTLARIKHVQNPEIFKEHIKNLAIEQKRFNVTCFKLIKSTLQKDGAVHEVLQEYK